MRDGWVPGWRRTVGKQPCAPYRRRLRKESGGYPLHLARQATCEHGRTHPAPHPLPYDLERSDCHISRWNGTAADHTRPTRPTRRPQLGAATKSGRTVRARSREATFRVVLGLAGALLAAGCAAPASTARPTPSVRSAPIVVGPNVDVSNIPGSQDEVSAAVDPNYSAVLLAGSNSLQADNSVRVYSSSDTGQHWTSSLLPLPAGDTTPGAVDQGVAIGPHSEQAMSYIAFGRPPQRASGNRFDGLTVFVATRSGPNAAWQAPTAPVDGVAPTGTNDDKDTLAFDIGARSPYLGRLYVAWDRELSNGSTAVLVSHSTDGGHTWSSAQTLIQQGQNWGTALTIAPDGTVTGAWASETHLWIAQSRDGGAHFSTPTAFGNCTGPMYSCVLGANIPAQTDAGVRANLVLVTVPARGPQSDEVLALYADGNGSHTQIYLARFDQATLRLSGTPAPVPLGTPDTDEFLPGAAYDMSDGELWVCGYVAPVKTPATAQYTCTASSDAGLRFLPATPAATVASNEEQPGAFRSYIGRQYGDYTAVIAANGAAQVFWTDSRRLQTLGEEIYTATLHLNVTGAVAR